MYTAMEVRIPRTIYFLKGFGLQGPLIWHTPNRKEYPTSYHILLSYPSRKLEFQTI